MLTALLSVAMGGDGGNGELSFVELNALDSRNDGVCDILTFFFGDGPSDRKPSESKTGGDVEGVSKGSLEGGLDGGLEGGRIEEPLDDMVGAPFFSIVIDGEERTVHSTTRGRSVVVGTFPNVGMPIKVLSVFRVSLCLSFTLDSIALCGCSKIYHSLGINTDSWLQRHLNCHLLCVILSWLPLLVMRTMACPTRTKLK